MNEKQSIILKRVILVILALVALGLLVPTVGSAVVAWMEEGPGGGGGELITSHGEKEKGDIPDVPTEIDTGMLGSGPSTFQLPSMQIVMASPFFKVGIVLVALALVAVVAIVLWQLRVLNMFDTRDLPEEPVGPTPDEIREQERIRAAAEEKARFDRTLASTFGALALGIGLIGISALFFWLLSYVGSNAGLANLAFGLEWKPVVAFGLPCLLLGFGGFAAGVALVPSAPLPMISGGFAILGLALIVYAWFQKNGTFIQIFTDTQNNLLSWGCGSSGLFLLVFGAASWVLTFILLS